VALCETCASQQKQKQQQQQLLFSSTRHFLLRRLSSGAPASIHARLKRAREQASERRASLAACATFLPSLPLCLRGCPQTNWSRSLRAVYEEWLTGQVKLVLARGVGGRELMRTPSSIVGNMTSCSLPPRVGAVQPPWCLSILIPSPSSFIGSRPLTNSPLFFSFLFFLFYYLFLGSPWASRLIVWVGFSVGLGWVGLGQPFFLFLAKFSKLGFFSFFKNG